MSVAESVGWNPPESAIDAAGRALYPRWDAYTPGWKETQVSRVTAALRAAMEEMGEEDFVRAVKATALFEERDWWADQREGWSRDLRDPTACVEHGEAYLSEMVRTTIYITHHVENHAVQAMHGQERTE